MAKTFKEWMNGPTNIGGFQGPSPASMISTGSNLVSSFLPEKSEYSGDKGNITLSIDLTTDAIADAAMMIPGAGMMVGAGLKAANMLGKGISALGGGTDGMTTADAILGSSLGTVMTLGLNGFTGKKADTITKDTEAFSQVGSSYGGAENVVQDALSKSGKKYGGLSSGARRKANELIHEAGRLQWRIGLISNNAKLTNELSANMGAMNNLAYANQISGGYDQSAVRAARLGGRLTTVDLMTRIINIAKKGTKVKKQKDLGYPKEILLDKDFMSFINDVDLFAPNLSPYADDYRMYRYWELYGKPTTFSEAVSDKMFLLLLDGYHANSIALNKDTGDYEFVQNPNHPTTWMEIEGWYNNKGIKPKPGATQELIDSGERQYFDLYDLEPTEDWNNFRSEYLLYLPSDGPWKYIKIVNALNPVPILEVVIEAPKMSGASDGEPSPEPVPFKFNYDLSKREAEKFKKGGSIEEKPKFSQGVEEFKKGGAKEDPTKEAFDKQALIDAIKYQDVNWVKRLLEPKVRTIPNWENTDLVSSHKLSTATLGKTAIIFPIVQEIDGELIDFSDPKNSSYGNPIVSAVKRGDIVEVPTEELALWFTQNYKPYFESIRKYTDSKPSLNVEEYALGGQMNVIPEGALHARKHNMENAEELTKKGIPVVDNSGELQAEIERNEIIFSKEVTDLIEEYFKKYKESEKPKVKDKIAILAGRLLADEIINNTDDRTGLILTV